MDFNDAFYHHMSTWLDADEFQVDDAQVIQDRAFGWACALAADLSTPAQFDDLIARLEVLVNASEWDGRFLRQAIECTNLDWTADAATGEVLRHALRVLMSELANLRPEQGTL
jgi:hypothetical protein